MASLQYKARRVGVEAHDVDDVVAEALITATLFPSPDKPPPPPDDEKRVKAWLLDRVEWAAKAHLTRLLRSQEDLGEQPDAIHDVADERDDAGAMEHRKSLRLGLAKVRPDHAEILLEHELDDVPIATLARERDMPYATAYSYWRRGRDQLRLALDEIELPNVNPRRRHVFFPPLWPELGERAQSMVLGIGRSMWRLVRAFFRHGLGLATAAGVLFAPPGGNAATETTTAATSKPTVDSNRADYRIVELSKDVVPSASPALTPQKTVTPPARARALPPQRRQSAVTPGWDISLSLRASTAAAQGRSEKANTLLGEDALQRPAVDKRMRDTLRNEVATDAAMKK